MGIATAIDWAAELRERWNALPAIIYADKPLCASALRHYLGALERAGFQAHRERIVNTLIRDLQAQTHMQLVDGKSPPMLEALNGWLVREACRRGSDAR
jgi:hypothetical protein